MATKVSNQTVEEERHDDEGHNVDEDDGHGPVVRCHHLLFGGVLFLLLLAQLRVIEASESEMSTQMIVQTNTASVGISLRHFVLGDQYHRLRFMVTDCEAFTLPAGSVTKTVSILLGARVASAGHNASRALDTLRGACWWWWWWCYRRRRRRGVLASIEQLQSIAQTLVGVRAEGWRRERLHDVDLSVRQLDGTVGRGEAHQVLILCCCWSVEHVRPHRR